MKLLITFMSGVLCGIFAIPLLTVETVDRPPAVEAELRSLEAETDPVVDPEPDSVLDEYRAIMDQIQWLKETEMPATVKKAMLEDLQDAWLTKLKEVR